MWFSRLLYAADLFLIAFGAHSNAGLTFRVMQVGALYPGPSECQPNCNSKKCLENDLGGEGCLAML
jgi:hypothetical protein